MEQVITIGIDVQEQGFSAAVIEWNGDVATLVSEWDEAARTTSLLPLRPGR